MRIVVFIEPVVFWEKPGVLAAHLIWPAQLEAALNSRIEIIVASNQEVCAAWLSGSGKPTRRAHVLDGYLPLACAGWDRAVYSKRLYVGGSNPPMQAAMSNLKSEVQPDLIILTSQNAFVEQAFSDTPRLYIEQAMLPRYRQPFRTGFDPRGHQVGSLLESRVDDIRTLAVSEAQMEDANKLLLDWKTFVSDADPRARKACQLLRGMREGKRVAILATQPPDWSTYEGAYKQIDLQGLVCEWADELPPGWIGVPTYHAGRSLSEEVEAALSRTFPQLKFLPKEYSQGCTEPLLTEADAIVSISSTATLSALLLGKRAVVVGQSPLTTQASHRACNLDLASPLPPQQILRLLIFLTHRMSRSNAQIEQDPEWLWNLLSNRLTDNGEGDWQLDIATWTAAAARALFDFTRC